MLKKEYVCFSCGHRYQVRLSLIKKANGQRCPHCSSTSVMKLSELFGSSGG